MGRSTTAVVAAVLVTCAMLAGCSGGAGGGSAIEGPVLAVVSYSPPEVVLMEPETLAVITRVRLRSMGTDPLALPGQRTFVTAQCGGLGNDADDSLALIDLERGGRVRYVKLPVPNPGFVQTAGDGSVVVSHGVWSPEGIPVTRVAIEDGSVLCQGSVPNAHGTLVAAAGSLWTSGPEGSDITRQAPTVRRTSFDLASSDVFAVDGALPLLAPDGVSAGTLLTVMGDGDSVAVRRVSAEDLAVITSVTIDGLREGVWQVVNAGDTVVLRDSSGVDMDRPGGPLVVLDRATLGELRRIDLGGSVASIAALGTSVYAVTWDTGELIEVDPDSGAVVRRARIEGLDGKMTQVAAMDVIDASGGP